MGRRRENFWKCDPKKALRGCRNLTAEERGVYWTLLNLMYEEWEPILWCDAGAQRQVMRAFGDSAQKTRAIINRLLAAGRIHIIKIEGRDYLIDDQFAKEFAAFTGQPNPLLNQGGEASNPVEKSGESAAIVATKVNHSPEKNADYGRNSPIKSKGVAPRIEKEKKYQKGREKSRKQAHPPPDLPERWIGNPSLREAVVQHHGEGFAVSYLDTGRPLKGGVKARTQTAYLKLSQSMALQGVRVVPPD